MLCHRKGMIDMFDRLQFDTAVASVATAFDKTAPTIADWCDGLAAASDDDITLSDLQLLARLQSEVVQPNYAANLLLHHLARQGRSIAGQAGF